MIKLKNILTEDHFKKGDKVKYTGKKTIFTKLDPNKVYDVQDVIPDGHGDHTYLVNQYPVKAKDLKKESITEAIAVTDDLIMKMKPGSTIKMKGNFLRSILLTKDKYGNWRSEKDPNDILVNRQIAKIAKGKKAHKAGNTYMIEDTVTEATATITLSQEDMDKLHGDGSIDVDGVTITYQEPANPQPQDEVRESKMIKLTDILNEVNKSDVKYAMKMAFDSVPGNWHKALKSVNIYGKEIGLVMSSYMGPNKTLQAIVDKFNISMGTKFKIDKDSFEKGHNTSIRLREGKLTEAIDQKLAKLFQVSKSANVKMGEDKLYKLSQDWESWNVDNDDKYDDLVDSLFAAVELVQDAGQPGKNNVTKDKEYYMYMKSADKHLKQFNKDVVKAMRLHK